MAECIIARGGRYFEQELPIVQGHCSILVTVKDSDGRILPNSSIHCNDGGTWYNYHTNENGQSLFVTNSGQVDIIAWNFSLNQNCKYMDQAPVFLNNIDCPVSTSKKINLNLSLQNNFRVFGPGSITNIYSNDSSGMWAGDYKFIIFNKVNAFLGGGGGGGGTTGRSDEMGGGGGGGGVNIVNNYVVSNKTFKFYVGSGGRNGNTSTESTRNGLSGGTTSAFDKSATGGEGGHAASWDERGGNGGGTGIYFGGNGGNGSCNGNNSNWSNWGGGGGGGTYGSTVYVGGSPGGGNGSFRRNNAESGVNGGGGGGGSYGGAGGNHYPKSGGSGKLEIYMFR